ncbi:MAG: hypothetical protein R2824_04140 [Saprospiraceae bacterium]|nr:hypothetical protein [Lewinella sp.]
MRLLNLVLLTGLLSWGAVTVPRTSSSAVKAPADKEAMAREIFEHLVEARGDSRVPKPHFVFSSIKDKGAKASGGTITLEEAAYDVCASFGEDTETALAGLLAHELIHYYEKHEWEEGFISTVKGAERSQARDLSQAVKEDLDAFKKDEIEADYMGGFLAYMAGYNVSNVMPEVLEGIYRAYNLPDTLSKYPPLDQRKAIATETHQQLSQLVDAFDMANLLAGLQAYDEAATYYQFILEQFQSREMYNNAGVVYTLAAMPYFKKETLKYIYPVELDLNSRLKSQTRDVGTEKALREDHLQEAIIYFERAAHLDSNYPRAWLNLACAHTLMGQSLEEISGADQLELASDHYLEAGLHARKTIRLAEKTGDTHIRANAYILLGILAELEGKPGEVAANFDKGSESELASLNKTILKEGALPKLKAADPAPDGFMMEEQINELSLDDFRNTNLEWDRELTIGSGRNRLKLQSRSTGMDQSTILMHSVNRGRKYLLVQRTGDGYTGETAWELKRGAGREEIEDAYRSPDYLLPVSNGLWMIYDKQQIIFQLENKQLKRWYVFRKEL